MKIDVIGRRMFLTGAGASLAVPFMPSLVPRTARAQVGARPVRYVQVINPYGPATRHFFGSLAPTENVETHVAVRPLADVDGDISPMLGARLTALRHKITLIHGMDVISRNANHNMCYPTCASSYASGLDGDAHPPVSGQPSVDVVLAASPRVYDALTPNTRRLLVLNPTTTDDYTDTRSFSWQFNASGEIEMVRPTKTTLGLSDLLMDGFAAEAAVTDANAEQKLLDGVYDDYRRVLDGSRLAAEDRVRLEDYMTLVSETQRLDAGVGAGCSKPGSDPEVDIDAVVTNQFRLLAAAMACGLTRVASVTLGASEGYGTRHGEHHDFIAKHDDVGLFDDFVKFGQWVATLVESFESLDDVEGTLLDNSIVYWSSQYGNACLGDVHRSANMPVMVAGGAGGQLRTGYYVDYRKDGHLEDKVPRGVPLNNLLVTFMNCMGLSSTDYEQGGHVGYGDYTDEFFASEFRAEPERWSSSDGRRSPLPFFYQGELRG